METETAAEAPVELPAALPDITADTSVAAEPVANIADASESLEDILNAATGQVEQPMDILPSEPMGNIENQDPKSNVTENATAEVPKEPGTFNLGVPGLKFSANNVKTAKDGTKMVQIHQSQITPDQLLALQNNPNIKVVFRHVPSGKSYTKPPRHLLPPGYTSPIKKRKAYFTEEELEGPDVYNFDEGDDLQGPAKRSKLSDMRAKYMHGYGNVSRKKGRPRAIPDTSNFSLSYSKPSLPAKVILTDLLGRVNNPNAKIEVKLHTSQINAEVLANMELNPTYKIILTTKQELPPLVIENVNAEEQAKLEHDAKEIEKQEQEKVEQEEKQKKEEKESEKVEEKEKEIPEQDQANQNEEAEKRRLEEEEREKEAARQKKLAEEEEDLKRSVASPQISRSGRIRKPSRFSLDIARLTKRKSSGVSGGDSSAEDSEHEAKSKLNKKLKAEETVMSPPKGKPKEKSASTKKDEEEAKRKAEEEEKRKAEEQRKKEEEERRKKEEEDAAKKKLEEEQKEKEVETEEDTENKDSQKEQVAAESEKEVSSTDSIEKKDDSRPMEDTEQAGTNVASVESDTSADANASTETAKEKKDEAMEVEDSLSLKLSEEEEKEVIDNKFRLRKLLEQCSTEEIRSVLLPEAFDSINIGDFLLYKADQMHNPSGKISFPQLYREFEKLHKDASREATRYNTLVRRANKVGGEKRMEKIVLMPVYNIEAANSLEISNSSIDAHICGIQRTITTEMIAANSFFIKSKMDSPSTRLSFPEITVRKNAKPKEKRPLYTNQHQQPFASTQQPEPDSTTPDKPKPPKRSSYGQKIASMKFSTLQTKSQMTSQVRRPAFFEQLKSTGQITLGGQNHQITTKAEDSLLQNIPVNTTSLLRSDVQSSQMAATATAALAQLQATADQQQAVVSTTNNIVDPNPIGHPMGTAETTLVSSASDTSGQAEQFFVTEDGVPVNAVTAEDGEVRKQLVPIGDGQYVELPEGYSLIQTSEGYIIGQPGSTFTQGEDGNVYITNSDGTTTEITQQDVSGATDSPNIIDAVTEG